MHIAEIEFELKTLVKQKFDAGSFIFRFLEIYDAPKATVTKLKQGNSNLAKEPGDLLWKNKLFFRVANKGQATAAVDVMAFDPLVQRHKPRLLFATDGEEVYCRDIKTDKAIDIDFDKLNDSFDFFLPLAGIEPYEGVAENPADIKATGRIAKLYDVILESNPDWIGRDHTHELNLFMTRMLFCFFAEDTSIFENGLFTSTLLTLTSEDGTDTASVLETIFSAMNAPNEARTVLPEFARRFPYVNGGLFREATPVPKFSKRARRLLKECGDLNWREINPDIFGSMIQAVVKPEMRGDMGMHYTSVPNIMKVLQPLFLLSLEEDFEAARESETRLKKLLEHIYKIRVFDPACGSGNFLIIAYRELRKLETRIFQRLKEVTKQWSLPMSGIRLNHFYGIELADFAAETAKLSLWIAEYQMNEQFKAAFGSAPPALPLNDSGKIVQGDATRVDWFTVCPSNDDAQIYIVGNPPYSGNSQQTKNQKDDMRAVFADDPNSYKKLDYVSCWYHKAKKYSMQTKASFAFVSTNSICQGEQVNLLWPSILQQNLEISFAHLSFKWRNNAAKNAGVTCVIVGVRPVSKLNKTIYDGDMARDVRNIGPYLIEMDNTIVQRRSVPLSSVIPMDSGSKPADGGHLILSGLERANLVKNYPQAEPLLKRYYGSKEFIQSLERWCLWIADEMLPLALSVPPVKSRIHAVRDFRLSSTKASTAIKSAVSHQFGKIRRHGQDAIIVPSVSSERRAYLSAGLVAENCIISNLAFAIYDAPAYVLSIISSRLHAIWTATVGGRRKTDYRYSNTLVYNTFPIPDLSAAQKSQLEAHAIDILGAREAHPGKTIAWLYDPETMPTNLLKAHRDLDDTLERIYIGRSFKNDTERLEHLFRLYAAKIRKKDAVKARTKEAA